MQRLVLAVSLRVLLVTPLAAQTQQSPLRDLPPLQVAIDHLQVWLTDSGAESLRHRVILRLRAAGVPVTEGREPETYGSFLLGPMFPANKPTFLVSLNMVPDGCAFVANVYVQLPMLIAG